MPAGKILVILPSSRFLRLKNSHTCMVGYHLKELAVPVKALRQNDYKIVIATPGGETPFVDPNSLCDVNEDERLFYEVLIKENTQLLLPLSLDRMSEEFLGTVDGVLIPGGFATLTDFWKQPALKHILKNMHKHCKPTAVIGHGTIALAYDLLPGEEWLYKDYAMTCTPEPMDNFNEDIVLSGKLEHRVAELLLSYGANVTFGPDKSSGYYVEDRELITGQGPESSKAVAARFVSKLDHFQRYRSC